MEVATYITQIYSMSIHRHFYIGCRCDARRIMDFTGDSILEKMLPWKFSFRLLALALFLLSQAMTWHFLPPLVMMHVLELLVR